MKKRTLILTLFLANSAVIIAYFGYAFLQQPAELMSSIQAVLPTGPTEELSIMQAQPFGSLDPHNFEISDQPALSLVYEPLVRFDAYLTVVPALASTWYYRTPTELALHIRSDATWHTATPVTCTDVAYSLDRAENLSSSIVSATLSGITATADTPKDCVLHLPAPDFNLLRKLTNLMIVPAQSQGATPFDITQVPGSGRYQFVSKQGPLLSFAAYDGYYAHSTQTPVHITLTAEPKKYIRLAALKSHKTDILLDLPSSFASQAESRFGYSVERMKTYDSTFLLFNFKNPDLARLPVRQRIIAALHQIDIPAKLQDDAIYATSQFVPSGVFGFASDLIDAAKVVPTYDPADARIGIEKNPTDTTAIDLISPTPLDPTLTQSADTPRKAKAVLSLAVTADNQKLAQIIKSAVDSDTLNLDIRIRTPDELLSDMHTGASDMVIFGWRFDLGFPDDFLMKLMRSRATLNGFHLDTPEHDQMLQAIFAEQNEKTRLDLLQQFFGDIVQKNPVGIPLIGTQRLAALRTGLATPFAPRMDGLLIFSPTDDTH